MDCKEAPEVKVSPMTCDVMASFRDAKGEDLTTQINLRERTGMALRELPSFEEEVAGLHCGGCHHGVSHPFSHVHIGLCHGLLFVLVS